MKYMTKAPNTRWRKLTITNVQDREGHHTIYEYQNNEYVYTFDDIDKGYRETCTYSVKAGVVHQDMRFFADADYVACRLDRDALVAMFEKAIGFTLAQFDKYMQRRDKYCKCGDTRIDYAGKGYPGEYFYTCRKCGAVRYVDFNESEVI